MKKVSLTLLLLIFCAFAKAQIVSFNNSHLPIIWINTNGQTIPDDPKITADMGIINNPAGQQNTITDVANEYSGKIGIEIRGQSSQMFPQKSYSLELRDATGKSVDKSLFGLPKEADWVLYAPYTDKTLMRNVMAYQLAREMGGWSAHTLFVEVVLNGKYIGVYVFMERIKRGSGRVNVAKMATTDVTGDAVTGGYIFSIDKEPNGWFSSVTPTGNPNGRIQYSYVYPKIENIVKEQKDYLKSYVDSFEMALNGFDFRDPQKGYTKYINTRSFIDFFIVNEVSRNVDGFRLSTYLYKNRNSLDPRIYAGPVWDYDLAYRNANYCEGSNTSGWAYQFNTVCPGDYFQVPFWWDRLMLDTSFTAKLRCRWKELRSTVLSADHLNKVIDSSVSKLGGAQNRQHSQWPVLGKYIWPNPDPIPATYEGEISALKAWLEARLRWLDDNMPDNGACSEYPPLGESNLSVIIQNPLPRGGDWILKTSTSQTVTLRIVDASGRVVYSGSRLISNRVYRWTHNDYTPQMASPGLYFFEFRNNLGDKVIKRIIMQ